MAALGLSHVLMLTDQFATPSCKIEARTKTRKEKSMLLLMTPLPPHSPIFEGKSTDSKVVSGKKTS